MSSLFGPAPSRTNNHDRPARRTRTWTDDNGMRHTLNERSYTSPGFAFSGVTRSAERGLRDTGGPRRESNARGGLLDGVFDVFESAIGSAKGHGGRRHSEVDGMAYGGGVYSSPRHQGRPRGLLSRVAAGLTGTQSSREPGQRRRQDQQPRSSTSQGNSGSRYGQRSSKTFTPKPSRRSVYVDNISSDDGEGLDRYDSANPTDNNLDMIEVLRQVAERHGREAKISRRELEQAARRPDRSSSKNLQKMAQKVEVHEAARDGALRDLEKAQDRQKARPGPREARRSTRHTTIVVDDSDEDEFMDDPFFDVFESLHRNRRSTQPQFTGAGGMHGMPMFGTSPFDAFESFFADFDQRRRADPELHQHFFSMPDGSFTASFSTHSSGGGFTDGARAGPRYQQRPRSSFVPHPTRPRKPPATTLKTEEARRLFESYNQRWSTLSLTDPGIPYPARGLKASNLSSRNTLYAPTVSTPVEAWSDETIMKANTQAFFLGAVGLSPAYTESLGAKIELGYDTARADAVRLQRLVEVLKKERVRWHSDRLGKRHGGRGGMNEGLQGDPRARAVYHGVCELLEVVQ